MSEETGTNSGDGRRKDRIAALLLVVLVASFGWSYYQITGNNKTIHDQEEEIVALMTRVSAEQSRTQRLQATIAKMESGEVEVVAGASRRGTPLKFEYEPGAIEKAWRAFQKTTANFEDPKPTEEELATRIESQDVNGLRGPDLKEIQCFEAMIGAEGSEYLRTIFEFNAEEAKFSRDMGMAGSFMRGLENLLAFFVTVGDAESLAFIEGFLTNEQVAGIAQTKFNGNYFTFASPEVTAALAECADAS